MGIAYGIKQGKIPASYSKEAAELASTMSEADLKDFASKAFDGSVDALNDFIFKQGSPPRPGLVFDRQKHRWVRPQEAQAAKPSKKVELKDLNDEQLKDYVKLIEHMWNKGTLSTGENLISSYAEARDEAKKRGISIDKSLDSLNNFLGKGGPGSGRPKGGAIGQTGKRLAEHAKSPEAEKIRQREKRIARAIRQSKIGAGEIRKPQPKHIREYWDMRKNKDNKCDQLDKLNEYLGKGGLGSGKKKGFASSQEKLHILGRLQQQGLGEGDLARRIKTSIKKPSNK